MSDIANRKLPRTKIIKCMCVNAQQDRKFGEGKRLHNRTFKSRSYKVKGWRCTVCSHHVQDETQ